MGSENALHVTAAHGVNKSEQNLITVLGLLWGYFGVGFCAVLCKVYG